MKTNKFASLKYFMKCFLVFCFIFQAMIPINNAYANENEYDPSEELSMEVRQFWINRGFVISETGVLLNYTGDSPIVDIPDCVKRIYIGVLSAAQSERDRPGKPKITEVIMHEGLETIMESAFYGQDIKKVVFPKKSLKRIEKDAFSHNKIEYVDLPESLEYIGDNAFSSNRITTVELKAGFANKDGLIGREAFSHNLITNLNIHENINETIFGANVFTYNKVKTFVVPKQFTSIPKGMFNNNKSLTKLVLHENLKSVGDSFNDCGLSELDIPESSTLTSVKGFSDNNITHIEFPSNITYIADYAFQGNPISSLYLGDNIDWIGTSAFADCNIKDLRLPKQITTLSQMAFADNKIEHVDMPNFLYDQDVGDMVFYGNQMGYWDVNPLQTLDTFDISTQIPDFIKENHPVMDYSYDETAQFDKYSTDFKTSFPGINPKKIKNLKITNVYNEIPVFNDEGIYSFSINDLTKPVNFIYQYEVLPGQLTNPITAEVVKARTRTEVYFDLNGGHIDGNKNKIT